MRYVLPMLRMQVLLRQLPSTAPRRPPARVQRGQANGLSCLVVVSSLVVVSTSFSNAAWPLVALGVGLHTVLLCAVIKVGEVLAGAVEC